MEEAWLTCAELAAYFRIKPATVRLWTRQGIPHLRCGRLVRFRATNVEQWLRQRQNGEEEGGKGQE